MTVAEVVGLTCLALALFGAWSDWDDARRRAQ